MRKIITLLPLILFLILWSCGGNSQKGNTNDGDRSEIGKEKNQEQKNVAFLGSQTREGSSDILDGYWHRAKYLDVIEQTKSVWEASRQTGEVISCGFMKDALMGENPYAEGASAHEGGFVAELEWDASANMFRTKEGGNNNLTDKLFFIKILSESEIALQFDNGEQQKYRKVNLSEDINDLLFTGSYTMSDGTSITFTSDGRISGHPHYENFKYSVVNDFFEIRMDAIRVTDPKGNSQFFHYVFDEEGFDLYEIIGNMEEGFSQGDLATEFVRSGSGGDDAATERSISGIKTHYFDLPNESKKKLEQILTTDNLSKLDETSLNVMGDYLERTVLAGNSQFGPYFDSNYFWYIYNALPEFVSDKERHKGYYKGENDQSLHEKLIAYSIYRIDRSPENIKKLFQYAKPFLTNIIPSESFYRMRLDQKVRGLLDSYKMISEIDDYKEKLSDAYNELDTVTGSFVNYDGHEEFRKFENSAYGFTVSDLNELVMKHLIPDVDRFHSIPSDLSFWMRRNHEGNMEEVFSILEEIDEMYK